MKNNILICGATGFIGRNLVEHFSRDKNNHITAVYHNRPAYDCPENVTWVQGDLLDAKFVNEVTAVKNTIIQAAATTSGAGDIVNTPYIHVTDNAVMNSLLLRSAFDNEIDNFVFFSCTVMYPSSETTVSEQDFNGEITDKYFGAGWTKVYIEKMCEFFSRLGKTKHTVIRHSNIYGPWDKFDLKRSHVFGATMTKIMTAKDTIDVWGTGEEKRDLLHVSDLLSFVEKALASQNSPYELLNCGFGSSVSVNDLVDIMIAESGKRIKINHDVTKPSIPFNLALDCDRARALFDWEPKMELDIGIRDTMKWWQENVDPDTLNFKLR